MIRRPPRSTQSRSSAASDVYKRQGRGADLDELRGLLHEVGFRDAGADGQHPAGIAHASRVGDGALVVTVAGQSQWADDAVGGQDGLQMGADVAVQLIETAGE